MRVPSPGRRRPLAALAAAVVCAVSPFAHTGRPAAPVARAALVLPPAGLDEAGYLAAAAQLQERLDQRWDARLQRYDPGPGASTTEVNADLLIVHAVAAQRG